MNGFSDVWSIIRFPLVTIISQPCTRDLVVDSSLVFTYLWLHTSFRHFLLLKLSSSHFILFAFILLTLTYCRRLTHYYLTIADYLEVTLQGSSGPSQCSMNVRMRRYSPDNLKWCVSESVEPIGSRHMDGGPKDKALLPSFV